MMSDYTDDELDAKIQDLRRIIRGGWERLDAFDEAEERLEQDEIKTRRKLDGTLLADDAIEYQMHKDAMASILSKQQHIVRSRGRLQREIKGYESELKDFMKERYNRRLKKLRAEFEGKRSQLLDDLAQAAENALVAISIIDGIPVHHINLDRIVEKHKSRFKDVAAEVARERLDKLREGNGNT